jgi:hypothetical protein
VVFDVYLSFRKSTTNSIGFPIYALVYFLINYVLFLIVNTGVEIALVRKLFKELQDKKLKLAAMNHNSPIELKRKIEEADKEREASHFDGHFEWHHKWLISLPEIFVFADSSRTLFPNNFLYSLSTPCLLHKIWWSTLHTCSTFSLL